MENLRHRRVKPPKGYPNADWSDAVYLKAADKYILELETRLESEEAHYTRLVEQLAGERVKVERLERAAKDMVHHHFHGTYDSERAAAERLQAALQEGEQE